MRGIMKRSVMLGETAVLNVFYYTGTKISGHQSPNSSMEIISILSGKYKIFTFVHSVSARVIRHVKIIWFLLFIIPLTVLLSSITDLKLKPSASQPTYYREIFRNSSHHLNTNKGSVVKQSGNDVYGKPLSQ